MSKPVHGYAIRSHGGYPTMGTSLSPIDLSSFGRSGPALAGGGGVTPFPCCGVEAVVGIKD